MQRLVEDAKKEGVVSLYSSAVVDDSNAIAAAFKKKYGIDVRLWRGSSEDILRRAVTEHRGGRDDVDVAETAGPDMEGLQRERLLQEISLPVFTDLIPQAVAPHRAWVTGRVSIFTAMYNTTLIKPTEAPHAYEDLLDPKWKGKLGIEADDGNWFMTVVQAMGEAKALPLFRSIVATNGMSVRKGHTLLANLVAAGEVPLALTAYGYRINEMKMKGAPVEGISYSAGRRAADRHRCVRQSAASSCRRFVHGFLSDRRPENSARSRQRADQPDRLYAAAKSALRRCRKISRRRRQVDQAVQRDVREPDAVKALRSMPIAVPVAPSSGLPSTAPLLGQAPKLIEECRDEWRAQRIAIAKLENRVCPFGAGEENQRQLAVGYLEQQ